MRKRKRVLIGVVLLLLLVMLVACNNNNQDVNNQQNILNNQEQINQNENDINGSRNQETQSNKDSQEKIIKKIDGVKKVGDVEVSNIQIELIEKGRCRVTADVKNTSDKDLPPTSISIRVINESGDTGKVFGAIIPELIWYEESQFVTYVWSDITDAHDIEINVEETN